MASVRLVVAPDTEAGEGVRVPAAWARDDRLTFDNLGLLTVLAAMPAGWHDLAVIAKARHYGENTLRVIADELANDGYVEIRDDGAFERAAGDYAEAQDGGA